MDAVSMSDIVIVVVPLFVDANANPDFKAMDAVTRDIGKALRKGMLISYETTLPIGTTRERFLPVLEELSGLKAGIDFNLVFSPERVLTGRVFSDLRKYPKIVGGVTESCTQAGVEFYSSAIEFDVRTDLPKPNGVWAMDSSESSEFVKLAETTYRDVNIGLANQFATFAFKNGLDIYDVISAANSQPYSHIHTPGISVGGHCIPIYPQFYLWNDPEASIVESARKTNSLMPSIAIKMIEDQVGSLDSLNIGVFGITYRPKVKETAFSGALDLLKGLKARGANVFGFDPLLSKNEIEKLGFMSIQAPSEIDVIILHTAHEEFNSLNYSDFSSTRIILDGRNCLKIEIDSSKVLYMRM
jgi:nucleotide sugar dehydrogenase